MAERTDDRVGTEMSPSGTQGTNMVNENDEETLRGDLEPGLTDPESRGSRWSWLSVSATIK